MSSALEEWRATRSDRIAELFTAHRTIGGTRAGRRYGTEQLNWALTLRVAAEFQGFARALHDEAIDYFTPRVGVFNTMLSTIVRARLSEGRQLDKKNATPSSLGSDFGRLGMVLWPDLKAHNARADTWRLTLEAMNDARNAIAHDDQAGFAKLEGEGWKLSRLATIQRFQRASGSLAQGMDIVVGRHLERLFGEGRPW